jgi:Ca2+-binding RTX toxin-like protein
MTTHTISHDRSATWNVNQDKDTWTLNAGAELYVTGAPAVTVGAGFDGNTLNINGSILNTGQESIGIYVQADDTTVNFGAKSEIVAIAGVYSMGKSLNVYNHGHIDASQYGITATPGGHVVNSGEISSFVGITLGSAAMPAHAVDLVSSVVNQKGGEILGVQYGVMFTGANDQKLVNDGLISGVNLAIGNDGKGALTLVNRGRIDGNIQLSDGYDQIDTRQGVIHGEVNGGSGSDTYIIGKSKVDITETMGNGYDTVRTTASYTLADNLDELKLEGKSDIDGRGNDLDNMMVGNGGDNEIFGRAGIDILYGAKGNDILSGGAGIDYFWFVKGDGVDRITDFQNDIDDIGILEFAGVKDFSQLSSHLSQHGTDVWVSLGSDRIVIEDIAKADLDAGDFFYSTK